MKQTIIYVGLDVDDTQYHGSAFHQPTGVGMDFHCRPTLKGLLRQLEKQEKGVSNAIFGQSETYRRGRGGSITPVSGLKMRGAGCEKGLPGLCAQDIPKNCGTVGNLRWMKTKGECWLRV